MRILILNYEYPPLGGGAAVATAALAHGLVERGVAVDVVTAEVGFAGERRKGKRAVAPHVDGGLTLYRVKSRRRGVHEAGVLDAASYLRAAFPLVRELLRTHEYDAVHFFFSLPTGALLPFLNLRDIPVVVSLRGSDVPGYDPHNSLIQAFHRLLTPVTRWIWRRADRVVAVCESLGRLAQETAPDLSYAVIPNGVDLKMFHPPAIRPTSDERRGKLRCLAVARLVERKGLGDLIRAMALHDRNRFELEIVGGGPDEQVLRDLVQRLGLQEVVRFAGVLDREAVAQRYREADLFTLPSSAEAFGNVFAEALASGLPIVGSNIGGIPDLVEHGSNGLLVRSSDVRGLADAIGYLAEDPDLRADMSRRNRAKAEATLQWPRVTDRYLSIYHSLQRRAPASTLVPEPTVSTP
jgi:glycosyltransferase involved in cell wall biosynthesis